MQKVKQIIISKVDMKKLRKRAGLTFAQLANVTGVPYSHLCRIEKGHVIMTEKTWEKIKKALDEAMVIKHVNN